LALYTLRLDSRLIAFEYCLRDQGQIALLKISFDPGMARYSPGHVLRLKVLKRECDLGEVSTYSMGPESEWKHHWATRVEPMARLRVYRAGLPGAVGYAAGPGVVRLLARSPRMRSLAQRIHAVREARRRRRRLYGDPGAGR
jgi:CelD/BcsL family acetyltransferase involved in cellulose biosynthesis